MSTSAITARSAGHNAHATRAARRAAAGNNRGKIIAESALLVVIAVLLVAGLFANADGAARTGGPRTQVFVEKGQSLWSLAREHPVAGQSTEQTARLIADLNGLHSGVVPVGATLLVPATLDERVLTASRF